MSLVDDDRVGCGSLGLWLGWCVCLSGGLCGSGWLWVGAGSSRGSGCGSLACLCVRSLVRSLAQWFALSLSLSLSRLCAISPLSSQLLLLISLQVVSAINRLARLGSLIVKAKQATGCEYLAEPRLAFVLAARPKMCARRAGALAAHHFVTWPASAKRRPTYACACVRPSVCVCVCARRPPVRPLVRALVCAARPPPATLCVCVCVCRRPADGFEFEWAQTAPIADGSN